MLATLQPGQTLSSTSMTIIDHNTWSTSLWRTYSGESRKATIGFIKTIFIEALHLCESEPELISEIEAALQGFNNLKETYAGDYPTIGEIETIINTTRTKLLSFKKLDQKNNSDSKPSGTDSDKSFGVDSKPSGTNLRAKPDSEAMVETSNRDQYYELPSGSVDSDSATPSSEDTILLSPIDVVTTDGTNDDTNDEFTDDDIVVSPEMLIQLPSPARTGSGLNFPSPTRSGSGLNFPSPTRSTLQSPFIRNSSPMMDEKAMLGEDLTKIIDSKSPPPACRNVKTPIIPLSATHQPSIWNSPIPKQGFNSSTSNGRSISDTPQQWFMEEDERDFIKKTRSSAQNATDWDLEGSISDH